MDLEELVIELKVAEKDVAYFSNLYNRTGTGYTFLNEAQKRVKELEDKIKIK